MGALYDFGHSSPHFMIPANLILRAFQERLKMVWSIVGQVRSEALGGTVGRLLVLHIHLREP